MRNLIQIRGGRARVENDEWVLVGDAASLPAHGRPVFALKTLNAQPSVVDGFDEFGIALAPDDDPEHAGAWLGRVALVVVEFPAFTDGRGYSTAVLLRTRLGWRGDLRAVGDVLHDQLFYLRRVGFTSFAVRADKSAQDALTAFDDFSDVYQGSVEPALPAYARRAAVGAGGAA